MPTDDVRLVSGGGGSTETDSDADVVERARRFGSRSLSRADEIRRLSPAVPDEPRSRDEQVLGSEQSRSLDPGSPSLENVFRDDPIDLTSREGIERLGGEVAESSAVAPIAGTARGAGQVGRSVARDPQAIKAAGAAAVGGAAGLAGREVSELGVPERAETPEVQVPESPDVGSPELDVGQGVQQVSELAPSAPAVDAPELEPQRAVQQGDELAITAQQALQRGGQVGQDVERGVRREVPSELIPDREVTIGEPEVSEGFAQRPEVGPAAVEAGEVTAGVVGTSGTAVASETATGAELGTGAELAGEVALGTGGGGASGSLPPVTNEQSISQQQMDVGPDVVNDVGTQADMQMELDQELEQQTETRNEFENEFENQFEFGTGPGQGFGTGQGGGGGGRGAPRPELDLPDLDAPDEEEEEGLDAFLVSERSIADVRDPIDVAVGDIGEDNA